MVRVSRNIALWLMIAALSVTTACGGEGLSTTTAGELSVEPGSLSFPRVVLGESATLQVTLRNTGSETIRLWEKELIPASDATVSTLTVDGWPGEEVQLSDGEALTLSVTYAPQGAEVTAGALTFSTNVSGHPRVEIPVQTRSMRPEIVATGTVSFGDVAPGAPVWQMATIQNVGSLPLTIDEIQAPEFPFSLTYPDSEGAEPDDDSSDAHTSLAPDETAYVRVWFAAQRSDLAVGEVVIRSDDPLRPEVTMHLLANGEVLACEPDHEFEEFEDRWDMDPEFPEEYYEYFASQDCQDAPAPSCSGDARVVWSSPGYCLDGICSFFSQVHECPGETIRCEGDDLLVEAGYCLDGECHTEQTIEPCDGPPVTICVDADDFFGEDLDYADLFDQEDFDWDDLDEGKVMAVFTPVGTCSDGACDFELGFEVCDQGCDPDLNVCACPETCEEPPPSSCVDADRALVYAVPGTCDAEAGECVYEAEEFECAYGCDPDTGECACPACDDPPPSSCDGDDLLSWEVPGGCSNGECVYDPVVVSCDDPPAAECIGSHELLTYGPAGACVDGACDYSDVTVFCEWGCADGACVPPVPGETTTWGTEFWLAFLENIPSAFNGPPTLTIMVGSHVDTAAYLEVVATGMQFPVDVPAGGWAEVDLGDAFYYPEGPDTIAARALRVVSDEPVQVVSVHKRVFQSDASHILPLEELSDEYVVVTPEAGSYPASMAIVAVEDGTEVEVTPSVTTLGFRPAGQTFTVTLDAGDVYQIQATEDLSGTHVKALDGAPVAVFGGVVASEVECGPSNHMFHQNLPVSRLGREYLVTPFYEQEVDHLKVVASQDGTEVRLDCGAVVELDAHEFFLVEIEGPTRVTASAPVAVGHFNRGQACNGYGLGDPSFVVVPPAALTTRSALFRHSTFQVSSGGAQGTGETFVNVWTEAGSTLLLDGISLETQMQPFTTAPGYDYVQVPQGEATGDYVLYGDAPFSGMVYGYSDMDTYSYHFGYDCTGCVEALGDAPVCL